MGCNMCVVQKPEEQYRFMFQVRGKELSRLSRDPTLELRDPALAHILRRGPRRRAGPAPRVLGPVTMGVADCVDSCTQTDISFQHMMTLGRGQHPCGAPPPPHPPPSPPLPPLLDPYLLSDLFEPEYYDPADYLDITQHEVDRPDDLEYEEVELYKSRQQDKLGLTVCYRTDEEEDLGIYVGEVNPNSIAAVDGRIRKGDRILQINGVDIQDREEAVAILTRDDSTNISLLLARPDTENGNHLDQEERDLEPLDNAAHLSGDQTVRNSNAKPCSGESGSAGGAVTGGRSPVLIQTVLSNSQELDSGVGRTDESTRYEESSEHDLLGDDHTSASNTNATNTNATNTPGSMRKFITHRAETPPLLHSHDLQYSTDSLLGLDGVGGGWAEPGDRGYGADAVMRTMMMPGLTEEECERYKELLEIKCYYEKNCNGEGDAEEGGVALDVNRNESLSQHELALLEEELRHLEFKCRNILRAQKMQQLRERCMKAWPLEDKSPGLGAGLGTGLGAGLGTGLGVGLGTGLAAGRLDTSATLSDINEIPERDRSDKDSTSAYNTGGESCRSTPLVSEQYPANSTQSLQGGGEAPVSPGDQLPPLTWQRADQENNLYSPQFHRRGAEAFKVRSLSRGSDGAVKRSIKTNGSFERTGGHSAENSPYLSRRRTEAPPPQRFLSCIQLRSPPTSPQLGRSREDSVGSGEASPMSLGSTCKDAPLTAGTLPLPLSPRMEWKVKIRSDGTRYVAKRPVRDRLLKARAMKISEERSGMTTDDDAVSEMKMGRYWSKEERKRHLLKAREQRRRREFMMQSRLECLRERERDQTAGQEGAPPPQLPSSILELCHRRSTKKRSRRILDNWITIQELLAHGTRSADGTKVYNPLLSVTTV
ncbi:PDZ domain-containing protein 4-like [Periophthalmus magnuspinnatus]|uniref:PDZ domain-containing protein 4-like n=1 Tax=Periophthalmus magnuspinnatus TaxID=409849 RepID=UPI002436310C|nr:PDZ domain-containing protein 4-like [Periophthalmus magnuspinnatus]